MKRILIVGSRPKQERDLEQRFKGRVKFTFFNDPSGSAGLQRLAAGFELIILNTGQARHSHQVALRQTGKPFFHSKGAVSTLAAHVEDLLENSKR